MAATTGKRPQGPGYGEVQAFKSMEMNHMPQPVQRSARGGFNLSDETLSDDKANFPASQYPEMIAEDTRQSTRSKVVTGANFTGDKATMVYNISDEDFKYYEAKEAAEEFAAFERWVVTCFDFKKPTEVDRFARMFPSYFERRMATIKNVADANVRYAEIVLRGPQSSDDFLYLWLVQTGKIPLIEGPLWDPSQWSKPSASSTKMALFNPWKIVNGGTGQMVPYAIGTGNNWTYPGVPQEVKNASADAGGFGSSKREGQLYNTMFKPNEKTGVPGFPTFASYFNP